MNVAMSRARVQPETAHERVDVDDVHVEVKIGAGDNGVDAAGAVELHGLHEDDREDRLNKHAVDRGLVNTKGEQSTPSE